MLTALRLHTLLAVLLALSAVYPLFRAFGAPYAVDGRWHELFAALLLSALTAAVLTRPIRRATRRQWSLALAAHALLLAVLLEFALSADLAYAWVPALPVIAMTGFLAVAVPVLPG